MCNKRCTECTEKCNRRCTKCTKIIIGGVLGSILTTKRCTINCTLDRMPGVQPVSDHDDLVLEAVMGEQVLLVQTYTTQM